MTQQLTPITLEDWDRRYEDLRAGGLEEPFYGGPLSRHLADNDYRLRSITYDNSAAALNLWNFLLTEEERLAAARRQGKRIVGAMKDLGTVPVLAYSLPDVVAFYPDAAWWIPCVMEMSAGLLDIADSLGVGDAFCPVRAMLGAFVTGAHFPEPDLLTCSVGAVCDDFSAIAQRLEGLGREILWWEIPHRRAPGNGEEAVMLPGGCAAPVTQVTFVADELARVRGAIEEISGHQLDSEQLRAGIRAANRVRGLLRELRHEVFTAACSPLPALEMMIAEMLAIHFCSDRDETEKVLVDCLELVRQRIADGEGYGGADTVRIFWVNPVADLRAMNLLEKCGGRVCGTDYLFMHALDEIPEQPDPMTALAMTALSDTMAGSAGERADRICREAETLGSEAVIVSRIPGASHCALEGRVIEEAVSSRLNLPVLEIEVPPLIDAIGSGLRTRIGALVETVRMRREQ